MSNYNNLNTLYISAKGEAEDERREREERRVTVVEGNLLYL